MSIIRPCEVTDFKAATHNETKSTIALVRATMAATIGGRLFHFLVLQEYWVLTESRILLKPVLGGVRIIIVALSISSHEQTQ